jgi:predicted lysophospholipase L1 biosynthesis ABC-type transport system permease subunit
LFTAETLSLLLFFQFRESRMKLITTAAIALGVAALTACNQSAQDQAADNIEANAEMTADNLEEAADNASTEASEDSLENQADATRAAGENAADAVEDNATTNAN